MLVDIMGKKIELTNLAKMFWPNEGYTKAHLLQYYSSVAHVLLPYLSGFPIVMKRYPDGIKGKSFYQKECPGYAPDWFPTVAISSQSQNKIINFCLINDLADLIWVVNQGCIEMHPWLSSWQKQDYPAAAIFDLDPAPPANFHDVLQVASLLKKVLQEVGLKGYPKTSGATGLHIYLPLNHRYTYNEVRSALANICGLLIRAWPEKCTLERTVSKRAGKVYLDFLQNGRGKTIASVYSVRPFPGAPVSVPLTWEEVDKGGFLPGNFHMKNFRERLKRFGDLFQPVLLDQQDLDQALRLKL
jgi:bifunctional non-homologous end joining protein LigD